MNWKRLTESARGETFNPLIWPCLFTTFAYGLGFAVLFPLDAPVGDSSLAQSMEDVAPNLSWIWGIVALFTIFGGLFFLLFNKPPVGKFSGLLGFMVWIFAGACYIATDDWLVFWAIAFPNMWFWFWQYLSLTAFRQEEIDDEENGVDNVT